MMICESFMAFYELLWPYYQKKIGFREVEAGYSPRHHILVPGTGRDYVLKFIGNA